MEVGYDAGGMACGVSIINSQNELMVYITFSIAVRNRSILMGWLPGVVFCNWLRDEQATYSIELRHRPCQPWEPPCRRKKKSSLVGSTGVRIRGGTRLRSVDSLRTTMGRMIGGPRVGGHETKCTGQGILIASTAFSVSWPKRYR